MKPLKIVALLVLTLGAMRAVSWIAGWLMARFTRFGNRSIALASNTAGFGIFAVLLFRSLLPDEPVDGGAIVFGLVVFGIYCARDWYAKPWERK